MAPRQITTSNSTLAYDLLQSIHDIQSNQNNASDIAQTVGLYFFGFLTLFGVYDVWRHQRWERAAGVKCLKGHKILDPELQLGSRSSLDDAPSETDEATLVASREDLDDSSFGDSDTVVASEEQSGKTSKVDGTKDQNLGLEGIHPDQPKGSPSEGANTVDGTLSRYDRSLYSIETTSIPAIEALEDRSLDKMTQLYGIGSQFWVSEVGNYVHEASMDEEIHLG